MLCNYTPLTGFIALKDNASSSQHALLSLSKPLFPIDVHPIHPRPRPPSQHHRRRRPQRIRPNTLRLQSVRRPRVRNRRSLLLFLVCTPLSAPSEWRVFGGSAEGAK